MTTQIPINLVPNQAPPGTLAPMLSNAIRTSVAIDNRGVRLGLQPPSLTGRLPNGTIRPSVIQSTQEKGAYSSLIAKQISSEALGNMGSTFQSLMFAPDAFGNYHPITTTDPPRFSDLRNPRDDLHPHPNLPEGYNYKDDSILNKVPHGEERVIRLPNDYLGNLPYLSTINKPITFF